MPNERLAVSSGSCAIIDQFCPTLAQGLRRREGYMEIIQGEAARALIADQIAKHGGGIVKALAKYDPADTAEKWLATIRAIEEFINVPLFGLDDDRLVAALRALPLDERIIANPNAMRSVVGGISETFGADLARRYALTITQTAALNIAFRQSGWGDFGRGITLDNVDAAITYFQSRRRHLVAMLYSIPGMCKGTTKIASHDTLNIFIPQVEMSGISLIGLHRQAVLADVFPDFALRSDGTIFHGTHDFQPLDSYFLDPERASLKALAELRLDPGKVDYLETVDPAKIFSAAELRNGVKLLAAAYAEFGLLDTDFSTLAALVTKLSHQCRDDYFVTLDRATFETMIAHNSGFGASRLKSLLVNVPADYVSNTNAFEPFIDLGDRLVSNVNLLSRFLYDYKNFRLDERRRFQVHSGFIFEKMVKRELEAHCFDVTDIKRINRKEFDVVAVRNDVIFNFQCKNNWIDLGRLERDRVAFVKFNRRLISYYQRALAKEEKREGLLQSKLGTRSIRHYIVSRFPIITDNERIIAWNAFNQSAVFRS